MPGILREWLALSLYTVFMGFCFCDGFGLNIFRKLIWFSIFLAACFYSVRSQGDFDIPLILMVSSLTALFVCAWEKRLKVSKPG